MIHHLVVVKFQPNTPPATVTGLFAALARLPSVIPGILHYAGGPYSSPEGLNQGFTHGFLMSFVSAAARDTYLTHPEHEQLKRDFLPSVENVVAFDFEE
jgi:hypothetical protein